MGLQDPQESTNFRLQSLKKGNEKAPDYRGKGNFKGVDFEMSLWVNEGKNGKYFSVKFKEPYQSTGIGTVKATPEPIGNDTTDLPF